MLPVEDLLALALDRLDGRWGAALDQTGRPVLEVLLHGGLTLFGCFLQLKRRQVADGGLLVSFVDMQVFVRGQHGVAVTNQFLDDVQWRARLGAQAHQRVPQAVESYPNDRPAAVTLPDFLLGLDPATLKERLDVCRKLALFFGMEGLHLGEQVPFLHLRF